MTIPVNTSAKPPVRRTRYMDFVPNKKPTAATARPVIGRPTSEVSRPRPAAARPVTPKTAAKKPASHPVKSAAPDAASYTLGGKSPFLTSVNVEKRPLSGVKSDIPQKNTYKKSPTAKPAEKKDPVKIVQKPQKKGNGLATFFIIVLTIILGAAAGAAAYFLLPIK